MRAALFDRIGMPLLIETIEDPKPTDGQVIVEVEHCGICGSDLHVSQSDIAKPGLVLGHEFAGRIVDPGRGGLPQGMRVTALPIAPCFQCEECVLGEYVHCPEIRFNGIMTPGGFAEYVAVTARLIQPIPDGIGWSEAAMVEPLAVARHAVRLAGPLAGADILVMGGGPIGVAVILFAALGGARTVALSEPAAGRRNRGLEMGATQTIDPSVEDVGTIFHRAAGRRPDIVFECVGMPGRLGDAIGLVRPRGRVVVAGACMTTDSYEPQIALMKEVSVQFSAAYTVADFAGVIDALARREINPTPMLTGHIALDALPDAFESLRTPTNQCKLLVDPKR